MPERKKAPAPPAAPIIIDISDDESEDAFENTSESTSEHHSRGTPVAKEETVSTPEIMAEEDHTEEPSYAGSLERKLLILYARYSLKVMTLLPRENIDGDEAVGMADAIGEINRQTRKLIRIVRRVEDRMEEV